MRLDLDGILEVTAVEKQTGKAKQVTIANALRARSPEEIAAARRRVRAIYETREELPDEEAVGVTAAGEETLAAAAGAQASGKAVTIDGASADRAAADLLQRSQRLLDRMHEDDRAEAIGLQEEMERARESGDSAALQKAFEALRELLFFVEGQAN
jgi:molecular chaperone DnaK